MPSSPVTKVAFLFGSGISRPAGMPSSDCITQQLLSVEAYRDLERNFCGGPNVLYMADSFEGDAVPALVSFLQMLKDKVIDPYYLDLAKYYEQRATSQAEDAASHEQHKMLQAHFASRSTNYEDLLYLAEQINECLVGIYGNPAVQPVIHRMVPDVRQLLPKGWQFDKLAVEAVCYIDYVVMCLLWKKPEPLDHLKALVDACIDEQISKVDIFTLNHDTVLEQALAHSKLTVTDGFGEPENEARYWQPDTFESQSCKVRLFKLHGSINWFERNQGSRTGEVFCIPLEWDVWRREGFRPNVQWRNGDKVLILTGTLNKVSRYADPPYLDLHWRFYHYLGETERLIICGYGFGDVGINKRIAEWIESSPNRKATIVHPRPDTLFRAGRCPISSNLCTWYKQRKLSIVRKPIEETSWKDIKGTF
jgi:hypothetical protein